MSSPVDRGSMPESATPADASTADTTAGGATAGRGMYGTIERKIRQALDPTHLEVTDESYMHAVPPGAESHFRLLVVSQRFSGKSAVQRHQAVYAALADEMKDHIHALGLQTMTPSEWTADQARNHSPECLGGGKAHDE